MIINYGFSGEKSIKIDETELCPICKKQIKPHDLHHSKFENNNNEVFISILYLCKGCYKTFMAQYKCFKDYTGTIRSQLQYIGPQEFAKEEFDKKIAELSPKFVQIYNEALQAESLNMNDISGIGYRKAFEFLIKDFFIMLNPSEEAKQKIIELPLGEFFNNKNPYKLDNEKLNKTAQASIWIGNDFAHYYRRHEDFDIESLKNLIKAALHYISCELEVIEADKLLSKPR